MPPKVAAYKKIAAARATQAAAAARAARRAEAQGLLQQQGTAADPIVIAGNDRPGDQADVCNPSGHGSSDVVMGGGVDSGDDVHRDSDSESEIGAVKRFLREHCDYTFDTQGEHAQSTCFSRSQHHPKVGASNEAVDGCI